MPEQPQRVAVPLACKWANKNKIKAVIGIPCGLAPNLCLCRWMGSFSSQREPGPTKLLNGGKWVVEDGFHWSPVQPPHVLEGLPPCQRSFTGGCIEELVKKKLHTATISSLHCVWNLTLNSIPADNWSCHFCMVKYLIRIAGLRKSQQNVT